ncbi:MAG: acyltransferase family protein, partial [Microvirga sp.]
VDRVTRPIEFLLTRAYRIYPLYWIFTGLVLVAFVVNPAWELSGRAGDDPVFLLLSFLALPQARFPLLPLGWTLELELIFYLMVAVAMASGVMANAKSALGWLLVVFGLSGFAIGPEPTGGMVIFDILNPFMAAFGLGWLLRCLESRQTCSPGWLNLGAVVLFLCLAIVLPEREAHCAIRMAVSVVTIAAVMGLEPYFAAYRRLARPGCLVGNASFSIYLSHWFVLSVMGKLLPHLLLHWLGSGGVRALSVVLSVLIGIVVYELLEVRLSRWVNARRRPAPVALPRTPTEEPIVVTVPAPLKPPSRYDA